MVKTLNELGLCFSGSFDRCDLLFTRYELRLKADEMASLIRCMDNSPFYSKRKCPHHTVFKYWLFGDQFFSGLMDSEWQVNTQEINNLPPCRNEPVFRPVEMWSCLPIASDTRHLGVCRLYVLKIYFLSLYFTDFQTVLGARNSDPEK